jgi:cardiolipin synthase
VDDEYCTVGTANFDNRSFRLNFEITIALADQDVTQQVTTMLENDFGHARLVRPGELQEHGFWFRLAVQAARLTAPVQ